ncbi:hypothetical protein RRG08_037804 [Elysia crispata]|uniref:Uncharacterized protein n=1 Tax=Elysia crispata TaxID=231223 RepID=A0AAE1EDH1_9GAST|nr:hypothetical protein RRG08_037804 [Elysia crispata]
MIVVRTFEPDSSRSFTLKVLTRMVGQCFQLRCFWSPYESRTEVLDLASTRTRGDQSPRTPPKVRKTASRHRHRGKALGVLLPG